MGLAGIQSGTAVQFNGTIAGIQSGTAVQFNGTIAGIQSGTAVQFNGTSWDPVWDCCTVQWD